MQVAIDGVDAFVHDGGAALTGGEELILLVHGAGNDHSTWRYATRRLAAAGWPVAAVDLPGHGKTPGPGLGTVNEMAEWCLRLVDALGYASVIPIGHSMGTLIAMEMATLDSERVRAVGLIATSARMAVHPDLQSAADSLDPLAADLIVGWSHTGSSRFGHHRSAGMWMQGVNRRLLERNARSLGSDLAACAGWDNAVAFAELAVPTLVIVGQHDRMTPSFAGTELAGLTGASIVEVAGGSHASVYDRPSDVIDPLLQWLESGCARSD